MDLWGDIYLDYWRGERHPHTFVRDDGARHTVESARAYFHPPSPTLPAEVLASLSRRVLDLGCGAGSYTLFLENRGYAVTAIDASPGAVTVCQERECRDVRLADIDALPADLFDLGGMICMGNTLGIGQTPNTLDLRLRSLRARCTASARLFAQLRDPLSTRDPVHLAYHERNRKAGRPVGLVRLRLEYRGRVGDWWELWMPTEEELQQAAAEAGWGVRLAVSEGAQRLYELRASPEVALVSAIGRRSR